MSNSSSARDSARQQMLEQVLADYLRSVEIGPPLDQDSLIDAHPDLADELRSFFGNRDSIDRLVGPLKSALDATTLLGTSLTDRAQVRDCVQYFGDYELLGEVARGGMGVVYRARQVNLNRVVALKMILAGQLADDSDVKRFYAEAEAAAKLDHPRIVPIFEIGQHNGQHYFSMAFVDGESLAKKVANGPLAPREAAEIVKNIAEAVEYAHQQGIIHRDLKPANVLLDRTGQPRITDFGLAKQLKHDSGLTGTGQILGTPSYMPPEQAAGKLAKIGPASDVYSLGAILYCLLTGRPPFQAANPLDTLLQVLNHEPVPPRQLNPQVPLDLETISLKCLEKDNQRRYQSSQELVDELGRFLNGEPIRARPVSLFERGRRWCQRNPTIARLSAIAGSLAVILMLIGLWFLIGVYTRRGARTDGDLVPAHISSKAHSTGCVTTMKTETEMDYRDVWQFYADKFDVKITFTQFENGWGGYGDNGLYYETCTSDFSDATTKQATFSHWTFSRVITVYISRRNTDSVTKIIVFDTNTM